MVDGNIYEPYGPGFVVRSASSNAMAKNTKTIRIVNLRVEAGANSQHAAYDLMQIGDPDNVTYPGQVSDVRCLNCYLVSPAQGQVGLRLTAGSVSAAPTDILWAGTIGNGARLGGAVAIDAGQDVDLQLLTTNTKGPQITVGSTAFVKGPVVMDSPNASAWTYVVDGSSLAAGAVTNKYGQTLTAVSNFAPGFAFANMTTANLTNSGAFNTSGGNANINATGSGATNLGTGTNTANVTLGNTLNVTQLQSAKSVLSTPIVLGGYTVTTLPLTFPTGRALGARAYVTDAMSCTYMGSVTTGGSTFCPVIYNGSAWVGD